MTTRRNFLSRMIAAGVAATLDPDELLWVPNRTHVSIPAIVKPRNFGKTYVFSAMWIVPPADVSEGLGVNNTVIARWS